MRISRSHYGLVFGVLVLQGAAAQVPEPIIDSPDSILHEAIANNGRRDSSPIRIEHHTRYNQVTNFALLSSITNLTLWRDVRSISRYNIRPAIYKIVSLQKATSHDSLACNGCILNFPVIPIFAFLPLCQQMYLKG